MTEGHVTGLIRYRDGREERLEVVKNTTLTAGKEILTQFLANTFTGQQPLITRMVFGNGGSTNGVPKLVDAGRTALFGVTVASKPVIAVVNPTVSTEVTFTSVLDFTDANGVLVNEMGLLMSNGSLYAMRTSAGLTKTSDMSIVWGWVINQL